jgi:hypothetical protein
VARLERLVNSCFRQSGILRYSFRILPADTSRNAARASGFAIVAGTPLFALQDVGGWSSAEMVRRYAHLAADHLSPYAEKLCCPLTVVPETLGTNWSQSAK